MNAQQIAENLENELLDKTTGYTTFVEVAAATALANASGYEIVVLDTDGRTVAYRYSDDSYDADWEVGEIEKAAIAIASTIEEFSNPAPTW